MVKNDFVILDEGKLKNISKHDLYNMKKYKPKYSDYCIMVMYSMNKTKSITKVDDDLNETMEIVENDKYIEPTGLMLKFREKYMEHHESFFTDEKYWKLKPQYFAMGWEQEVEECFKKHFSEQDLLDYLGITPFTPSIMINISPNWQDLKRSNSNKVTILKGIFENYLQEEWYDSWEYVIENGSDGNHIHLHAVCHINQKRYKSLMTHINKGHHVRQLSKYAKKLGGLGGIEKDLINGKGIQTNIIRCEKMLKDKKEYLHEETKPNGHKNKSVIENGFVTGCL